MDDMAAASSIGTGLAAKGIMTGPTIFDVQGNESAKGRRAPSISGQAVFGGGQ